MLTELSDRRRRRRTAAPDLAGILRIAAMDPVLLCGSISVLFISSVRRTCRTIRPPGPLCRQAQSRTGWSRPRSTPAKSESCRRSSKPVRLCLPRSISKRPAARAGDPRPASRRGAQHRRPAERAVGRRRAPGVGRRRLRAAQVRYRVGEGITGQVVATGKPIVVPRVSREPKFLSRAADRPELPQQELTTSPRRSRSTARRSAPSAIDLLSRPTATTTGP